ncbi:hypothetical protein [Chryseobacterium indoltheticum]|uniref:Uncharacterized protein n=1 Tax=Chryseobacterium indoltheticum TaxID=254 RepID=A0A381FHF8_9FLAO|nr:hypothetical protein [Chryseobacterium indoltheticum]AZA74764.1 hypothetical protein EG358_13765 [Chryseobacterium indoltheticum]SIQ36115.1 hypothetical protein SAMN05421682_104215 [Chryseobacterium indoltheticum]SUX45985.1 Uncharacterised protein [Chryseobacterium indoltheticum]
MKKYSFCPKCQIGLNSQEMQLGFCQNCKNSWEDEDAEEDLYDEELQRQSDDDINEMNDW